MRHKLKLNVCISYAAILLFLCGSTAFGQHQYKTRSTPEPSQLHELGWLSIAQNSNVHKDLALNLEESKKVTEASARARHEANLVDSSEADRLGRETVKVLTDSKMSAAQWEIKLRETRRDFRIQFQQRRSVMITV